MLLGIPRCSAEGIYFTLASVALFTSTTGGCQIINRSNAFQIRDQGGNGPIIMAGMIIILAEIRKGAQPFAVHHQAGPDISLF